MSDLDLARHIDWYAEILYESVAGQSHEPYRAAVGLFVEPCAPIMFTVAVYHWTVHQLPPFNCSRYSTITSRASIHPLQMTALYPRSVSAWIHLFWFSLARPVLDFISMNSP